MKKQIKITILLIFIWFVFVTCSNATIVSNDPTVNSGEKVTITLTSSETVQAFKVNISNNNGLTFDSVSNNTTFMGTPNGSNTSGISTTGGKTLATYTFIAPNVNQTTSYNVSFSGSISVDGSSWTTFSNTSKVTVKAPSMPANPDNGDDGLTTGGTGGTTTTVKSSNNYLKSLKLSSGTINFNKKTTKYTVNVEEEIENITITAAAEHAKASVSGTGKIALEKGNNTAKVEVTAEDGSVRTYTLTIVREGVEKENPSEEQNLPEEFLGLTSLTLKGMKDNGEMIDIQLSPEFSTDVFYYECDIPNEITRIDVENACDILDAIIEVTGNENLQEGENLINIIIKYTAEDREDKTITYQITINKLSSMQELQEEEQTEINKKSIAFISVAIVCVLIIIILIIVYKRQNKMLEEETEFGTYGKPLYDENEEVIKNIKEEDKEVIHEERKLSTKNRRGKHF